MSYARDYCIILRIQYNYPTHHNILYQPWTIIPALF